MISVIIPTHKRADLLFYELEHIYMQKDVDFEVIVVNDIEEEDETDVIREKFPQVIYIKDSKIQGPSNKHKAGLRIAKGEYLYMPDDDDFLTDEYFFKKAVSYMEQYPKVGFVSGGVNLQYQYEDGRPNEIKRQNINLSGYVDGAEYLQEFQHTMQKAASTVSTIYRKQAFDETDAINMIEMSDSSMYMQALLWGDAYIMDDVVAVYRVQVRSLTTTASYAFMKNVIEQKELLFKKSFGRIRNPRDFWANQFILSYNFWPNKSQCDKFSILLWVLVHCHCSLRLYKFFVREFVKLIIRK